MSSCARTISENAATASAGTSAAPRAIPATTATAANVIRHRIASRTSANGGRCPPEEATAICFARSSGNPASLATLSSQPVVMASAKTPNSGASSVRAATIVTTNITSLLMLSVTAL